MTFSQKLNKLFDISGVSNALMARKVNIDPSTISRWRRGVREINNIAMLKNICAVYAVEINTKFQRDKVSKLTGIEITSEMPNDEIKEILLDWLLRSDTRQAALPIAGQTGEYNRTGDHVTLLREFYSLICQSNIYGDLLIFLDETPEDEREEDRIISQIWKEYPELAYRIRKVRVIISSAGIFNNLKKSVTRFVSLKHFKVEVAYYKHFQDAHFEHSMVLFRGVAAVCSLTFDRSSKVGELLVSDPSLVNSIADSFERIYSESQMVHRILENVTMYNAIESNTSILSQKGDVSYTGCLGSILLTFLFPVDVCLSLIFTEEGGVIPDDRTTAMLQNYGHLFREFVQSNNMFLSVRLFTPDELLHSESAEFEDIHDPALYLKALRALLEVLSQCPSLYLCIHEDYVYNNTLAQTQGSFFSINNHGDHFMYYSDLPVIGELYYSASKAQFDEYTKNGYSRDTAMDQLKEYIGFYEAHVGV